VLEIDYVRDLTSSRRLAHAIEKVRQSDDYPQADRITTRCGQSLWSAGKLVWVEAPPRDGAEGYCARCGALVLADAKALVTVP
jgi:hypothetical protein